MANHLVRVYTAAASIVVFFLLWALVAAHPWEAASATPVDPRLAALAKREKHLQQRARKVKLVVDRRWALYERRLRKRQWQIAVAEQRHLRELEASRASAVRAAQVATAQASQARAYAASVVAWASADAGLPLAMTARAASSLACQRSLSSAAAMASAASRQGWHAWALAAVWRVDLALTVCVQLWVRRKIAASTVSAACRARA